MRYAILGDIHANLAALDAVLEAVDRADIDRIIQVGDVVGYGAHPSQAIARLRERDALVVLGNHDGACTGLVDPQSFNEPARIAIDFTLKQLDESDIGWLRGLPLVASTEHCTVSHGTLDAPERFQYLQRPEDSDASFDELETPVCFLGHTHRPVAFLRLVESPLRTSFTFEPSVDLTTSVSALINVGSVGQPRDEDHRAAWAVFDTSTQTVDLLRLDYDIECEADAMIRAGLPKILADRLFLGL